jgi:PEP-CTERM motif
MKLSLRTLATLPCLAAFLTIAGSAHASTSFTGVAFCDIQSTSGSNPQGQGFATSGVTLSQLGAAEAGSAGQCASFSGSNIDFNSGGVYNNPTNTLNSLSSFLASGGATATFSAHLGKNGGPNTTNSGSQDDGGTLFILQGTTYLQNGDSIQLAHDDGADIYVCLISTGSCNFATGAGFNILGGSPGQTTGNEPNFTVTGTTTGAYDYELIAVTNYEQPAQLDSNINTFTPVPEPSSIALLGTGLLAAAGAVRRRMKA